MVRNSPAHMNCCFYNLVSFVFFSRVTEHKAESVKPFSPLTSPKMKKSDGCGQMCVLFCRFYLLQPSPWSLLHVNLGPQHMVERGQEMMTDIQGELLNGFHLDTKSNGNLEIKLTKVLTGQISAFLAVDTERVSCDCIVG